MYYGSLTRLTKNLGYEPELAEEILSNDSATEWTFKIRKGVEFHDGKTLTADDVIYTMNRHLGKDSISNASSLVAMVNLPPKAIGQVENAPGKDIWALESSAYINIACRKDMDPSGNHDLIMAMKYLMDRQRLVKGVYKGQASLGNDHPIGPAYFDHSPDIPQRMMDPDKAKFHFEKSGVGNTTVPIVAAEVAPGAIDQCLFLQREAAKIGLNIDVQKVTTDGYWGAVWLKAPMCVVSWNMRPTANLMMTLAFKSDAPWNETYHQDADFDKILLEVRGVTDPAKRKEMYHTLQEKIHNENGSVIPLYRNYVDAVSDKVKGLTYVPLNNFGGAEAPVTMWRDDV